MHRDDKIMCVVCVVCAILTLVIGLNIIPKDEQGYAARSIDVLFIIMLFGIFWAVPTGMMAGALICGDIGPRKPKERGPSYKTKTIDGLTVRDYEE